MFTQTFFYRAVTFLLLIAIPTTSSIPIKQQLPRATSAYLGMMQQLGLIEPDFTAQNGFRTTAAAGTEGMEGMVPTIGPDGEPVGFLLNAEAFEMDETQFEPDVLADPISVSRVQSAYARTDALSNTLTITFTVTNNRPPAITPDLPENATITETIDAVSAIDFSNDPNVIRNVLLADDLLPANAVFVAASPMPDRSGDSMAWNLGDIPPLDSVTATLTVEIEPGSVPDFLELDSGASAWGTLEGRMVTAATAPAGLSPDGFGDWLQWTIDADYYDEYMVAKAAELGNDWQQMFGYVRSLGYESYKGSLRGTRGTLWSEAGNSLDQASLLIAMLRGSGIPARYRHGTLITPTAQSLILSMFPEPQGTIGHIPAGTEVADPANDPQLLAETLDHWWVEAYLPGLGWTNLDPCFAGALPGRTFHNSLATDGSDQIAEVPDGQRHKVTMTVKIEKYHPLNMGQSGLDYAYPLTHTFNTVELVGEPVTLGHLVNTDSNVGMVFYTMQHTYVPYFAVGDFETLIEGEAFQDMISNFPFGNFVTTGEWLLFDVRDADGNVEQYERKIFDKVGFDARQSGGSVVMSQSGSASLEPAINALNTYVINFASSYVPAYVLNKFERDRISDFQANCTFATVSSSESELLKNCVEDGKIILANNGKMLGQNFMFYSTLFSDRVATTHLARSYIDEAKIVIAASEIMSSSLRVSLDIQSMTRRVLLSPDQAQSVVFSTRFLQGLQDTALESAILETLAPEHVVSVKEILNVAIANKIPLTLISDSSLEELDALSISSQAKARIKTAVSVGKVVVVPTQMVIIDGAFTTGWLEIDEQGNTIGVGEHGMHMGQLDLYAFWVAQTAHILLNPALWNIIGFVGTMILASSCWLLSISKENLINMISQFLIAMTGLIAIIAGVYFAATATACISILGPLCILTAAADATLAGVLAVIGLLSGVGSALLSLEYMLGVDPPLPSHYIQNPAYDNKDELRRMTAENSLARQTVFASRSFPDKPIDASLNTISTWFSGTVQVHWASNAQHRFEFLTLYTGASLYDSSGLLLDTGTVLAEPVHSSSIITMSMMPVTLAYDGFGNLGLYAPSLSGLGTSVAWNRYTATISSTQAYTLTLHDVTVTVNDTDVYTGSFTLIVTDTTTTEGSGRTAAPNYANAISIQATDANFSFGPTAIVGGSLPFDAANSFALSGYTGPITVTEHSATLDLVELDGDFEQSLSLSLDPPVSTIAPIESANFDTVISSNLTDTYTVTVEGPPGWNLDIGTNGTITTTPPLGATPGDYTILVTAQSVTNPALVVSAEHVITTTDHQGMEMNAAPDPLITIPWGPGDPDALPGGTNNGQLQIPDAAYTIEITNTSTTSHTFAIDVTFPNPDWLIVSGAEGQTETTVTLPAGGVGQVGLYISPTLTSLPPAGTEYGFSVDVTATDMPTLTESASDVFVVPAIAFNQVQAAPPALYSAPGFSTTFDVAVASIGNAGGTFPVSVSLPISTWTHTPPISPLTLAPGARFTQSLTLDTTTGDIGRSYSVRVDSPSGGAYTQTDYVQVQMVSTSTLGIYRAAQEVAVCLPDDAALQATLDYLGLAVSELENDCADGHLLEPLLRDRVASGARAVANHTTGYALVTADATLRELAGSLETRETCAALTPDVTAIREAVQALGTQACLISSHDTSALFRPGATYTLAGHPVTLTLAMHNHGTLTTTCSLTPTMPASVTTNLPTPFTTTLAPNQAQAFTLIVTPTATGDFVLRTAVGVQEAPAMHVQATAGLRSLDAYLDVVAVGATPAFIEQDAGTPAALYADIVNHVNAPFSGTARTRVWDAGGTPIFNDTRTLRLASSQATLRYDLGTLATAGLPGGPYTITLEMLDGGTLIPRGSGWGHVFVGQAVEATHDVTPDIVSPGTVTVTDIITTAFSDAFLDSLGLSLNAPRPVEGKKRGQFAPWLPRPVNRPLAAPTADFSADPTVGPVDLSVDFQDLSTPDGSPIDAWLWDFGDGVTSTQQNPTHVYAYGGIYTVSLTVWSGPDVGTATKGSFIQAGTLVPQQISDPGVSAGEPAIAYNADTGDSLIVWQEGGDIKARLVDQDGAPINSPFDVLSDTTGTQRDPVVAYESDWEDRYLVVWLDERDGSPADVYGRPVNADGTMSEWEPEMLIAEGISECIGGLDIGASYDEGTFLVVWHDEDADGTATDIFGARVDAYGSVVDDPPILLVERDGWTYNPSLAFSPDSGFYLLAWADADNAFDIMARAVSADSSTLGTPFVIYTSALHDVDPDIAYYPPEYDPVYERYSFFVTWLSHMTSSGTPGKVMGRRIAMRGSSIDNSGSSFVMDIPASANAEHPQVRYDSETWEPDPIGEMLVVWNDDRTGTSHIYGQRVGWSGPYNQAQLLTANAGSQSQPALSDTGAVLAWFDDHDGGGIYASTFHPVDLSFVPNVRTGLTPQPITFNAWLEPAGELERWQWDFGDGGVSHVQTPTHVYDAPGVYTVTLSAMGEKQHLIERRTNLITLIEPTDYITITSTTTWLNQHVTLQGLWVTNGASLVFAGDTVITATHITVEKYAYIYAVGKGYGPGEGPGAGMDSSSSSDAVGGGGGHGGRGGDSTDGTPGGAPYGDIYQPQSMGSGGGGGPDLAVGGAGGGTIHLIVSDTLDVSGSLLASGDCGTSVEGLAGGGGGAGGSIWLEAGTITGTGSIRADGGYPDSSGSHEAGYGGGGRIAIYADHSNFSGWISVDGDDEYRGDGTLYFGVVDPLNSTAIAHPTTGDIGGPEVVVTVSLVTTDSQPVVGEEIGLKLFSGEELDINGSATNSQETEWIGDSNADGIVTATLSATTVGTRTLEVRLYNDTYGLSYHLPQALDVGFVIASPDAARSYIEASPGTLPVDGVTPSEITVYVRDRYDNPVPDQDVELFVTQGTGITLTQPTTPSNASGHAWGSVVTTQAQDVILGAWFPTEDITLTQVATVTFTAGDMSTTTSELNVDPTTVPVDGFSVATATVTLRDRFDNPIPGKTVAVYATGSAIVAQPAADTDSNGQAVATIRNDEIETVTVSAQNTTDGITLIQTSTVTFIEGATHSYHSTIDADAGPYLANGVDEAVITVTLLDVNDQPVAGHTVALNASGSHNYISGPVPFMTGADGVATFGMTSIRAETKTLTAIDVTDNIPLAAHPQLVFVPGPPDPGHSNAEPDKNPAAADNTPVEIRVYVRDSLENPIPGLSVILSATGTGTTLVQPAFPTNVEGETWGTLSSTEDETVIITASVGGTQVAATSITFVGPNLGVKKLGPNTFARGRFITYTLRIRNTGLVTATNVFVTDTLPLSITYQGQNSSYPVTPTGQTVVWDLGDLGPNSSAINIKLEGFVEPTVPVGSELVNHVTARAAKEAYLSDNTATKATTIVPPFDFKATLDPISRTAEIGAQVTFKVNVTNTGEVADTYTATLLGLETMSTTLSPAHLTLLPGGKDHFALNIQQDAGACVMSGLYPFTMTAASGILTETRDVAGSLILTTTPTITDLFPEDGATTGSRSVVFTWQTGATGTTVLYLKRAADTGFTRYEGIPAAYHQIVVEGLERNTDYEWYAETTNICAVTEQSSVQSLHVGNGLVFGQSTYNSTIERDYNQSVALTVRNEDTLTHTLLLTVENPSDELIVNFVGSGSMDQQITLAPGEGRSVRLNLHAQDAQQHSYPLTLRLLADEGTATPIQAAAGATIYVRFPSFDLTIQETDYDPVTMVHGFSITNNGDTLTDLRINSISTGDGSLYVHPGVEHGYLRSGRSLRFEAFPVIDMDFQALTATLIAEAIGHAATYPVTLTLTPGQQIYLGQADDVLMQVRNNDWYCTNRPMIETPLTLPSGFRRANANTVQLLISFSPSSHARPHTTAIYINGFLVGTLVDMIPYGTYVFDVDPYHLNEAATGPSANFVAIETTHLNGGHYVVATDMTLVACMDEVSDWVVASSQTEADQIVGQRSYLLPAPNDLGITIAAPNPGQTIAAGGAVQVTAQITDDVGREWSHLVMMEADNDNGTLLLHDDGLHGDGDARDGTYGNSWIPVNEGTTVLNISSSCCIIAGSDQVTVEVGNFDYAVDVVHSVPLSGSQPLTQTASPLPSHVLPTTHAVEVGWAHTLTPGQPQRVSSLPIVLPDMQPGEVRQVSSGTVVSYTGQSGAGRIALGPLYVFAPHLVAASPATRTASLGGYATYTASLTNPSPGPETYTITVVGLPEGWAAPPFTTTLSGEQTAMLPVTITVPGDGTIGHYTFGVDVENDAGGNDQAQADLIVTPGEATLHMYPKWAFADNGTPVSYTITLTNTGATARLYTLSATGLDGNGISLPPWVAAAAGESTTFTLTVTAGTDRGSHAFTVYAETIAGSHVIRAADDGVLVVNSDLRVTGALSPSVATGGQATPAIYTLFITNTGSLSDTYDVTLDVPTGWHHTLSANMHAKDSLSLTPYVFNAASLHLTITPADGTPAGDYPITATLTSRTDPTIRAQIPGTTHVSERGVMVEIAPPAATMNPPDSATWTVTVTNTGETADTFNLSAGGIVSSTAQFTPSNVTLAAGATAEVELSAHALNFALQEAYPFAVTAQSQTEAEMRNQDIAEITFFGFEDVRTTITPTLVTITDTYEAHYMLLITNTGNVDTIYTLETTSEPEGLSLDLEIDELYIPPHMTGGILLSARPQQDGIYTITVSADSVSGPAADQGTAILIVDGSGVAPQVDAGPSRSLLEGTPITLTGTITDPDTPVDHAVLWDFDDGSPLADTRVVTHAYGDDGQYNVTFTVTDTRAMSAGDALTITVHNVAPLVSLADITTTIVPGQPITFTGIYTDPGWLDTHTMTWDFGEESPVDTRTIYLPLVMLRFTGQAASSYLARQDPLLRTSIDAAPTISTTTTSHTYTSPGTYTVTLTVTDDDGGQGIATSNVEVVIVGGERIYLPVILRNHTS